VRPDHLLPPIPLPAALGGAKGVVRGGPAYTVLQFLLAWLFLSPSASLYNSRLGREGASA